MGKSVRCACTVCLLQSQCSYLFSRPSVTLDVIGQAQYMLDIKAKALPLYKQAFDIKYLLDMLVTMWSWVITFRLSLGWGKLD